MDSRGSAAVAGYDAPTSDPSIVPSKGDIEASQPMTKGTSSSMDVSSVDQVDDDSGHQKKKKKVGVACIYCRRSHMICDSGRPCQRCIKRKIEHLCHDEPANTKGRRKKNKGDNADESKDLRQPQQLMGIQPVAADPYALQGQSNQMTPPTSVPALNKISSTGNGLGSYIHTNPNGNNTYKVESLRGYESHPPNQLNGPSTSLNQQPFFYSEHAGSEFNSLTEFLSMIDDTDMINSININNDPTLHKLETSNINLGSLNNSNANLEGLGSLSGSNSHNASMFFNPSMLPQFSQTNSIANLSQFVNEANGNNNYQNIQPASTYQGQPNQQVPASGFNNYDPQKALPISTISAPAMSPPPPPPQAVSQLVSAKQSQSNSSNQTPTISDSARDKFFLTAADPTTEISPEERLKQVINAKLEAGLLKPYNYAKGYARLQTYMDNHMNSTSRKRILKPLSVFRPGFRAIAKTLKDIDMILVEENFERMLLDYDRVFTSMAIPACLWRRTGEIYRGNKEFASLVEVSIDDLKNGKLTIYELMTEESSVNFWEKYGSIAFDKTQKAVLSSCNLRTKDGRKRKNCCFSFTIRRDKYNIPSCIVGNFIPISN